MVVELVRKIVANARDCGAQAIACACPLCQVNLDSRQGDITKADPGWAGVPIVYLSQFVGRAIGVGEQQLGLKKHMVAVEAALA